MIESRLQAEDSISISYIKSDEVTDAIKQLNSNKSDGNYGLYSNHLLLSSFHFREHLAKLFTCMLHHGHNPDYILEAVISSIPKDSKGDINSSDNYRGIALSSVSGKVLDLIILSRYTSNLSSSDLQFAFKAKHSTVMCTSALKEIISQYTKRASIVYMCSLDATKAFDKVNFVKLFKLLLQRNIPSIVLRLILDLYTRQSVKAAWNCEKSFSFDVTNGVRQGGVLSPILFNVYFDELLHRLQQNDIGCHIGTIFTGALCYADDLLLLCPTIRGLQKMITICSEFATEYDVTFNPSKTACMAFGNRHVCPDLHLYLDGKMLEWTDTFKHLRNVITVDQKDDSDIQLKRGNFYRSVNGLCYKFKGTLLNSDVASRLFQTYCCSFYGSQAWNLSSSSFEFICTAWNKAVRRIFHLPYNTHRYLLPFIVQTSHIRYQLVERFRTFFATCMSSENLLINLVVLNAHFCNSPMSMNRRYADKLLVEKNDLTEEESGHAALLSSLLKIREQQWSIPNFDRNEIEMMVEFICTA